jgi:hypothetical protein
MKIRSMLGWTAAVVLAAGCDSVTTGSASEKAATPQPAGGPSFSYGPTVSVSVHCPANLEVGQSGQCVALGYDASGYFTTSSGATWSTTTSSLISVSSSGVVTGVAAGTATVSATIGGVTGNTNVAVRYVPVDVSGIFGQSTIRTNVDCFWWINPTGGTGSYTYTWTVVSGPATGTASGNEWTGRSSANFTLKAKASDGISADSATRSVTVSSTAQLCVI